MNWTSFWGAFLGGVIGILTTVGAILLWDYFDRRRNNKKKEKPIFPLVLEYHLEQYIVEHFAQLFPGWKIFENPSNDSYKAPTENRLSGIRFRTDAGEIDILAIDSQGNLVVIELKRDKASDRVSSQVDRYIAWVKKHLANPNQKVRGLIIAKSIEKDLAYTLLRRRGIAIWTYEWLLKFDKRPNSKIATVISNHQIVQNSKLDETQ